MRASISLWDQIQAAGTPVALTVAKERLTATTTLPRFYNQRLYFPAWSSERGPLPHADNFLTALRDATQEGLSPDGYHTGRIKETLRELRQQQAQETPLNPTTVAALDLLLTDAFLTYGTHLLLGRSSPVQLGGGPHTPAPDIDLAEALQRALDTGRIADTLHALLPPQPGYAKLRQALAHYRALEAADGWPTVPAGPSLRRNDRSKRVATLRTRLRITGDLPPHATSGDATLFDETMERAVRTFQQRHGVPVTGVVGVDTLQALNVPVATRVHQLVQNLDRWRWLPNDLGQRHILVNIPAFTLEALENDHTQLTMRVVVGKPSWPTPTFSAPMTYIVLRPEWNVPDNIAREELLPIIRKNPSYLASRNMEMRMSDGRLRIRQAPGPRNPLGDVKFMFPNRFHVYLHDTPSRSLFSRGTRTFSHGCVRLEKPMDLTAYVLRDTPEWTPKRIRTVLAKRTARTVLLPEPIPVHLVYRTAWVSEDGTVHFRHDVYGHDALRAKGTS
jgi:murein L,D-transpeptidase YcbB/YkuD